VEIINNFTQFPIHKLVWKLYIQYSVIGTS